jgi:iron complex outermembrane recepter protein
MKSVYTLLLFIVSFWGYANSPQSVLTGTIKDSATGQPLEFAQAALMKADSSLVTGGITDASGNFQLATTETGNLFIRVSYVGYENAWQPVLLNEGMNQLGTLSLMPASNQLQGVEISAGALVARTDGEKRIFNVENMTVAEGGTALQVLETLPSVQVDNEGNLTLRGNGNILILVDGKPTNLSGEDASIILQQYPASLIKEVELITNPSARYDAEGVGGIINIMLKQKRAPGINGQLNASVGTGNKYTGGVILNFRKNKLNLNTSYSWQSRESWRTSDGFREMLNSPLWLLLNQNDRNDNLQVSQLIRTGLDYQISKASSARVFANFNIRNSNSEGISNSLFFSFANQPDSILVRQTNGSDKRSNLELGVSYNWQNEDGSKLSTLASWTFDSRKDLDEIEQLFFFGRLGETPRRESSQLYERPFANQQGMFQLDYELKLSETRRFEVGFKSNLRMDERKQIFMVFDPFVNQFVNDDFISNEFFYDEQIHASYAIIRDKIGKFSYQAGLRGELTLTESYQPKIDSTYSYDYFRLFPSIFLGYDLGSNQNLQFSYSRRIRRPWSGSLVPFLVVQDEYNYRSGNPYLKPEFTDNFELNYNKSWTAYTLNAGIFHRYTTNALSRLVVPFGNATLVTWENADERNATGLELVNSLNFSRNLNARLTGNVFRSSVSAQINGNTFSNDRVSWSLNMMGNYNIPKYFSTQVVAFYQGPIVVPQGEILPTFALNLGFRRNVMNNQGTISLNVNDVFNTRRFALKTENDTFYLEREFNFDSRVVTLAFTYRFLGYRERNSFNRSVGFNGEMEDLF